LDFSLLSNTFADGMHDTRHRSFFFKSFSISASLVLSCVAWWVLACWPLAAHWAANPQYAYGWLVSPLAVFLVVRRWPIRPSPDCASKWSTPLVIGSALAVLPAWFVFQSSPGWRLAPSLLALSAATGSVGLTAQLGGARWARHFAFPFFFMLAAVPWPSFLEDPLVQSLAHFVASCSVNLLNFAGYPAVQHGSLVEVRTGLLGIDEACSGVRSLQASLMLSLFLGEFHRFGVGNRAALLGIGLVTAISANIVRTTFLCLAAARGGLASVGEWHDPAGFTLLTICLVIIALIAHWIRRRHPSEQSTGFHSVAVPNPVRFGWVLSFWFLVVVLGSEAWFFQPRANATTTWTLTPPVGAEVNPIPKATGELLGCDRSSTSHWRDGEDREWTLFFFEWFPKRTRTALLAQVHRPEICLPSAGLVEFGERRTLTLTIAGFNLNFESLQFRDQHGEDVFVFFCPWEIVPGKGGRNTAFTDNTRWTSLRRVWQRERVLGQQVAEFIVTGAASREKAENALSDQLAGILGTAIVPTSR